MKKLVYLLLLLVISTFVFAKKTIKPQNLRAGKPVQITITDAALADSTVLLAYYYNSKLYIADTLRLDKLGKTTITRDSLYNQGLYMLYVNPEINFEFLMGSDQTFDVLGNLDSLEQVTVTNATETGALLAYQKQLRQKQRRYNDWAAKYQVYKEDSTGQFTDSLKLVEQVMQTISDSAEALLLETAQNNKGNFVETFVLATYTPTLKEADIPADVASNDSLKLLYRYQFQKNNFIKYVDLSDNRLIFTPILYDKLNTYFNKVLVQVSDSILPVAHAAIERAQSDPKMLQYVTAFLLNNSLQSNVIGLDAVFYDLATKYYLSGKATWADSATIKKVKERVENLQNNLLGTPAQELLMEVIPNPYNDEKSIQQSLYNDIKGPYTVLAFWEPSCGHCKEQIPQLYKNAFLPLRNYGVQFIAFYTQIDKKEWMEFVRSHELNEWVNAWDPYRRTSFWKHYDIVTTPAIYLLDAEKKIMYKKLSAEQVVKILNRELSIPQTDAKP